MAAHQLHFDGVRLAPLLVQMAVQAYRFPNPAMAICNKGQANHAFQHGGVAN